MTDDQGTVFRDWRKVKAISMNSRNEIIRPPLLMSNRQIAKLTLESTVMVTANSNQAGSPA